MCNGKFELYTKTKYTDPFYVNNNWTDYENFSDSTWFPIPPNSNQWPDTLTYYVEALDASGNYAIDTFRIILRKRPKVQIASAIPACSTSLPLPIELTAYNMRTTGSESTFDPDHYQVRWSIGMRPDAEGAVVLNPSTSLSTISLNLTNDHITQPAQYYLQVTDSFGCSRVSRLTVSVEPPTAHAPLRYLASFQSVRLSCNDTSYTLIGTTMGGLAPKSYSIDSIDSGKTWQSSGLFRNLAPGRYEILAKDAAGCTTRREIRHKYTLDDSPMPELDVLELAADSLLNNCPGDTAARIRIFSLNTARTDSFEVSLDGARTWTRVAHTDTFSFEPLPRGGYNLLARTYPLDSAACWSYRWFDLSKPRPFAFLSIYENDFCYVEIVGGTPPYNGQLYYGTDSVAIIDADAGEYEVNIPCDNDLLYIAKITDANGCEFEGSYYKSTARQGQLSKEREAVGLRLYPNPTTGLLTLKMTGIDLTEAEVELYDGIGRLQHREHLLVAGEESQLDLTGLSAGIYQLHLRAKSGETFSNRVLITR